MVSDVSYLELEHIAFGHKIAASATVEHDLLHRNLARASCSDSFIRSGSIAEMLACISLFS